MNALDVESFDVLSKNTLVLDTRQPAVFTNEFIPHSVNIGLGEHFIEWIQRLIPKDTPLSVVADENDISDTYVILEGLGYQNIMGHLLGGASAWKTAGKAIDMIIDVSEDEVALDLRFDDKILLVDVREPIEFDQAHIDNAENLPLHKIIDPLQIALLDENSNIYVYCDNGYRSTIACSVFKKEGFHNIRHIIGGFNAIDKNSKIKIVSPKK